MTATFRSAIAASGAKEIVVKPGDTIPLKGVDVKVLASNRQLIGLLLSAGAGRIPLCQGVDPAARRHVGQLGVGRHAVHVRQVSISGSRRSHAGSGVRDGVSGESHRRGRPVPHHTPRLGTVERAGPGACAEVARRDHEQRRAQGWRSSRAADRQKRSRSRGLVDAALLPSSAGAEGNVAEPFIANLGDVPDPAVNDTGFGINVTVQPNGSFTVVNERNNPTQGSIRRPASALLPASACHGRPLSDRSPARPARPSARRCPES